MTAPYPQLRLRRVRAHAWVRALVAEHHLSPSDLIWPIFLQDQTGATKIKTLPHIERLSIPRAIAAAKSARALGIPALALFPQTPRAKKSPHGEEAYNPDNLVCRALAAIKKQVPDIGLICDVALDPYTTHGHDGLLHKNTILNDETIDVLVRQALTLAEAGADILAPSDMMDGRVGAIRHALEAAAFPHTLIMSYSAKYASALYGPFRDAVGSKSQLKSNKRSYQMNPAQSQEAAAELAQDAAEGADMLMIKPGGFYLDIVRQAAASHTLPVFAYQVSGEYAMLTQAARFGMDANAVMLESLLAFKRAGARGILTYFAPQAAKLLRA